MLNDLAGIEQQYPSLFWLVRNDTGELEIIRFKVITGEIQLFEPRERTETQKVLEGNNAYVHVVIATQQLSFILTS